MQLFKTKALKLNYKSIVWAIIIIFLSTFKISTPNNVKEYLIPHSDKLVHVFLYTIFSFVLLIENRKSKQKINRLLFAFFYGVLMELIQHFFTSYRSFELQDILANTTGVIFGLLIYTYIKKKLQL